MRRIARQCVTVVAAAMVASILIPANPAAAATVTVDNSDPGFSASTGWGTSSWSSQRYGADYRFATPNTTASDPAWYRMTVPSAGSYNVDIWYPSSSGYNSSAPFIVATTGGAVTVRVDQRSNGGRWVSLGSYSLAAGTYNVVGVSRWTSASGYIIADAVRISTGQILSGDFPDPDVSNFDGTYYAYSTNNGFGNVPVASASSITGTWFRRGDALPTLGAWAEGGRTWAPDVSRRADGRYLLYYTARSRAAGRQCIGVALGNTPVGPFAPVGTQPLICNPGEGGDIDASSFIDSTGVRYLLYKDDGNAIGQPTSLWLQRMSADGLTIVGGRVELLRSGRPEERGVIEAPALVKVGGRYVLFYSLGCYCDDGYQTSYATSTSLTGPYTKAFRSLMTTASMDRAVLGPGGADVIREPGGDHIVFHGWINNYSARAMYVAAIGWANGYPVVRGSRVRYEAERGTLNNCRVRNTGTASQGQVVAYMDYADSWVDIGVFAPRAGAYKAYIAYSAGYGDATHTLTVNGGAAQVVTYPNTGWETWRQVAAGVTLREGWNTIRLNHRTRWAELDYIEVA